MNNSKRCLLWHGMFLFLLGLFTGLLEQHLNNPRMGLAAHLEGVMNGTFLIALGAVWMEVKLTPRLKTMTYWGMLYGAYVNWAITLFAVVFGTTALTPITGAAHAALPWQEAVVTVGYTSVGIIIIASSILVLWGLRPSATS